MCVESQVQKVNCQFASREVGAVQDIDSAYLKKDTGDSRFPACFPKRCCGNLAFNFLKGVQFLKGASSIELPTNGPVHICDGLM